MQQVSPTSILGLGVVILSMWAPGCAGEQACREGTTLQADGHCYPPLLEFPPQFDDAVDALPACEPLAIDEAREIDVIRGCVRGACAGDTYVEMLDALGNEVDCVTTSFDNEQVYCTWETLGIDGLFEDDDRDDVPDDGARTDRIRAFPPSTAATLDGVGVGANTACFFDHLGNPDRLNLVDVGGELMVRDLLYDRFGLQAYDLGTDDDSGQPNGYVDNLYLFGEP